MPDRFTPAPVPTPDTIAPGQGPPGYQNPPFPSATGQMTPFTGGSTSDANLQLDIQAALLNMGVDVSLIPFDEMQQLVFAIKNDPYIQDLMTNQAAGLVLATTTQANLVPFIQAELSDPTQSHSPLLLGMGLSFVQRSGMPLTAPQQAAVANFQGTPANADPSILSAIASAAAVWGIPYNVALQTAMVESNLNPSAVGDQGCSHGLFQLNTCGGEGSGMSMQEMQDPYTNAYTALRQFAAVRAQNPGIVHDPGAWAAAAQRPADPSAYAARVNAGMTLGLGSGPSGSATGNAVVPKPFDAPVVRSLQYGQTNPWGIQVQWNEFAMPSGTPIYTPFAGQIVTQRDDQGWGTQVFVKMANGYTFHVGHMNSLSVSTGQTVNPGDVLGESGGVPSQDGNHEWSTGAHVDLTLQDASGRYVDPTMIFDNIFSGTATFASLGMTGAEGAGVSAGSAQDRLLGIDPVLESKYPAAASEFQKYFGRHPTASELMNLVSAAGTDVGSLDSYLDMQPSHVPGVSMGQYNTLRNNADSVSNSIYGFGVTDGMVAEMAQQGITSSDAIGVWLNDMSLEGKMDSSTYQAIWKLNKPYMSGVWGQPNNFDPRAAAEQYNAMQAAGVAHNLGAPAPVAPDAGSIVAQQGANAPGFRD